MRTRSILRSNSIPTTSHTVTYIICCDNFLFSCDYIPVQPENTLFPVGNIFNFPHLTGLPLMITSRKWYLNSDFLKKNPLKEILLLFWVLMSVLFWKRKRKTKKSKQTEKLSLPWSCPFNFYLIQDLWNVIKKKVGTM